MRTKPVPFAVFDKMISKSNWRPITDGLAHSDTHFSTMLMFMRISLLFEQEKDLEIPLLRHQLSILERKYNKQGCPTRVEKLTLAVLASRLKQTPNRTSLELRGIIRVFQPKTVLRWHREPVRSKLTLERKHKSGHPKLGKEVERLLVRLARENPLWAYCMIEGEFLKLGFKVSITTIRNVLELYNIVPAPDRGGSIRWRHLVTHYKNQILGCDFYVTVAEAVRPVLHRHGHTTCVPG